ncbi:MAG TPA: hypothetical protein VKP30_26000 [Polyangiaceae bacterium]|nr:hypothetical protein [Polyangiaceae bacterium]
MTSRRLAVFLAIIALPLTSGVRIANAQLGQNGSPIQTSRYAVDLFQGPVLASTRVIGMGGAYVAIAERVEGSFYNPAAPAVRTPWSTSAVDYDASLGLTSPGTIQRSDFFNSGSDRTKLTASYADDFVFLDAEGQLQIDEWGFGATLALQQYNLRRDVSATESAQKDKLKADILVFQFQAARTTANGQLVLGVGFRPTVLNVLKESPSETGSQDLFSTEGIGYSAGFLWRPNELPIRVGAAFNSAVKTRVNLANTKVAIDEAGNRVLASGTPDEMYLPERVALPWEFDLGFAVQFGARPFNPRWVGPTQLLLPLRRRLEWRRLERERKRQRMLAAVAGKPREQERLAQNLERKQSVAEAEDEAELERAKVEVHRTLRQREQSLGRWYILIATSLKVSGPVTNGVGIESFLQRAVDQSGRRPVLSPHLGLESEVISNWLKLRAGLYGEPTRFENASAAPRLHTTVGFEQKLFAWRVFGLYSEKREWRITGAADFSVRYFGWSASVGIWH